MKLSHLGFVLKIRLKTFFVLSLSFFFIFEAFKGYKINLNIDIRVLRPQKPYIWCKKCKKKSIFFFIFFSFWAIFFRFLKKAKPELPRTFYFWYKGWYVDVMTPISNCQVIVQGKRDICPDYTGGVYRSKYWVGEQISVDFKKLPMD